MSRSAPALLALALAGVLGASAAGVAQPPRANGPAFEPLDGHDGGPVLAEHRYRIVGKLRLAFIWVSRDNVGSARMTWRSDGTTSALTFLVGSNPGRAPRSLNEWSYLREEVRSDRAEVFNLRSLGSHETPPDPGDEGGPVFGVSCASFREQEVRSSQTTVDAGGATYWMFDRLLSQIAAAPRWRERRIARPAGAAGGFLTALQRHLRLAASDPHALKSAPPAVYVYNDAVYDLRVRDSRMLGRTTVGTRTFARLARTDFTIHNRSTGDVSRFGITYIPDLPDPSLPVQIFYQPSFWLRIELRLDEGAEVPADPSADRSLLARIRAICAGPER